MGEGMRRIAAACGGLTVTASDGTRSYDGDGRPIPIAKEQWFWKDISSPRKPVRVMAIVDDYVMYRIKGCAPAVLHRKQFADVYRPTPHPAPERM